MSLDLSAALRDAAEHAPVGTLEATTLGRRIRRRRASRTATRTVGGVGLAGVIALTASQTPDWWAGPRGAPPAGAVTVLPADEVAHSLPAADRDAVAGQCGWVVEPPPGPSEVDLAVALDSTSSGPTWRCPCH